MHNSCLYWATWEVCLAQFEIDISSRRFVFDRYNTHENGILFDDAVDAIDEALEPWGIQVTDVYGERTGEYAHRSLCRGRGNVPSPCIAFLKEQEHAVARLSGSEWIPCAAAWVLGRTERS